MIFKERIKQARHLRGLTQSQLAEALGVVQGTVAHFESGRIVPPLPVVFAIANATGVTPEFLEREPTPPLTVGSLAYRARASTRKRELEQANQYLTLLVEQMKQLSAKVNLPRLRFPNALDDPIRSARLTRVAFELDPYRPVAHLVNAMEQRGAVVFGLPLMLEGIDAFSTWTEIDVARPIVALSSVSAGDRLRFSAAHELGHLVMHRGVQGYPADMEKEANRFAAEFLFPEEAMKQVLSEPLTLKLALRVKKRWRVSIQMLIRRARDLGLITERHYRNLFQELSARGWRTKEPGEVAVERPRLYRQAAEFLYDKEYISRMAKESSISERLSEELLSQYDESYNARSK